MLGRGGAGCGGKMNWKKMGRESGGGWWDHFPPTSHPPTNLWWLGGGRDRAAGSGGGVSQQVTLYSRGSSDPRRRRRGVISTQRACPSLVDNKNIIRPIFSVQTYSFYQNIVNKKIRRYSIVFVVIWNVISEKYWRKTAKSNKSFCQCRVIRKRILRNIQGFP